MRLAWANVRVSAVRTAMVAVPVIVLASGCSAGGSSGAMGSGSLTVAVVPGIESAPLSVAAQEGLFQQHGLDVTVKDYSSLSEEYQALASGQVQIAVGDYTDFFYEQATDHASLRLIADGYDATANSMEILTLPHSTVTTAQQLDDAGLVATPPSALPATQATITTGLPYNIETLAADEVLQDDGVSTSTVSWEAMPEQNMITALHDHQVGAILATEPYILEAEEDLGAVEVADVSSGVTSGLPMDGYFSLASYANANPANVRAFQAALDQAQADCAQRGPVQGVLPDLTGITKDDAAMVTLGTYPTSLNVGQVQRVAALMYDAGMTSSEVVVNS
jgi:NitT/TauT family transport system substrate-binding protein